METPPTQERQGQEMNSTDNTPLITENPISPDMSEPQRIPSPQSTQKDHLLKKTPQATQKSTYKEVFSRYLEDTEELSITEMDGRLIEASGIVIVRDAHFRISINNKETDPDLGKRPKYIYRGTISLLSPNTRQVMISEARKRKQLKQNVSHTTAEGKQEEGTQTSQSRKELKKYYATTPYYSNAPTPQILAEEILAKITSLFEENSVQFEEEYGLFLPSDELTPEHAVKLYLDQYLSALTTNTERKDKVRHRILTTFEKLPNIPFSKLTLRRISYVLKNNNTPETSRESCYDFYEYLISCGHVSGTNIFPPVTQREPSAETKNRKAFQNREFSNKVFSVFFKKLNEKISTAYCGVALYASGFNYEEIEDLKWTDIEFVNGYKDFVIVPVKKDSVLVRKHDFSRPTIPDAALYLRKVFESLCKQYGEERVLNWPVLSLKLSEGDEETYSEDIILEKRAIGDAAKDLLLVAGYDFNQFDIDSLLNSQSACALKALTENYHRMLITKAGLANDPDTLYFLEGKILSSSTYTSYEAHVSPEATYRLYKILLPISVEKPVNTRAAGDGSFIARPRTNHEVAQVTGKITLKPGETLTIRIASGVTGRLSMNYLTAKSDART